MSCRDPLPVSDCPSCCAKSAYDIWRENQPIGADISLPAYLASMEGTDGTNGTDGINGTNGVGIVSITATVEPVLKP